jgi:hypothetical protein
MESKLISKYPWMRKPSSKKAFPILFFACCVVSGNLATACATPGPQAPSEAQADSATLAKLDTRLRAAIGASDATRSGAPTRTGGLDIDRDGKVLVDIQASVTDDLKAAITRLEGIVVSAFPAYNSIRARVPLSNLKALAARADVKFIKTAEQAITNTTTPGGR